jgi:hypothetical protein
MRKTIALLAALIGTVTVAAPADATVDAILDYTIVYQEPQSEDFCYRTMPMHAELGIPGGSLMQAVFAPVQIYNQSGMPSRYIDINLVSTQPPMVPTYVSDSIDANGTMNYAMKVDVTALAKANGTTSLGRLKTVRAAKLSLLAMARSMNKLSAGKYRLKVTFVGLPSQSGLPGVALPASTTWPYTASSPLLATLEKEWINAGGSCR